jgi:hypothetical protein
LNPLRTLDQRSYTNSMTTFVASAPTSSLKLRRLEMPDIASYRELRLQGLKAHPEAFASSWDYEADKPVSWWAERLEKNVVIGGWVDNSPRTQRSAGSRPATPPSTTCSQIPCMPAPTPMANHARRRLHRDGLPPSTPCRSPGALRSTPRNGHRQTAPAGPVGANNGHRRDANEINEATKNAA